MACLRTVLDATVVISALIRPDSPPGRILRAAIAGETVCLLTSDPLLAELRATLAVPRLQRYLRMSAHDREEFVLLLEQIADPVGFGDHPPPGVCRDPDDEPYLQTALAGRADFVVTSDRDLLDLGVVEHIPIVTPADFERVIGKNREDR